ncbi:MAG TPA: radical SAM protein [Gemmatimonadaceae bacterium]|nr:radical SAM protein [Gemmatimonadaceae bacterium]
MKPSGTLGYQLRLYGAHRSAVKRYARDPSETQPSFPPYVQLQTINACQASCTMCPFDTYSKVFQRGRIDDVLFEKITAEIAEHPEIHAFIPMLQNEPLLDKRLFDRLRRFRQISSGRVSLELVTNGALLTDEAIEGIRDVNLDVLDISLDAATRETYEKIRIGLDFDAVMAGVERAIAADLPNTRIFVRLVRQRDNVREIRQFAKQWRARGVGVFIYSAHDRAGSVEGFDERIRIPRNAQPILHKLERRASRLMFGHCPVPYSVASILHNGDVLTCVHDWARKEIVGNLRDSTLAEVWNGERMREIRALVSKRRYDEVPACRDCGLWKDGWF